MIDPRVRADLSTSKGKFKKPGAAAVANKKESMAERAAALLRLEGEKIEVVSDTKEGKASVLSDSDLDMLLDRSPEVFAGRGVGWTSSSTNAIPSPSSAQKIRASGTDSPAKDRAKRAAFAVYQAPVDEGSEALAKMFGGDDEDDD